ncbi:hypothetical protein KEH51_02285 [[Brevibacterium] frigoritolerans]|uniref:Uncharacterized protein n=1 Tax=Peribacillus frigoritolerans TaxID=450367 RepID=A0A941FFT5_9BACI|nr:hypothetical protein [Peribacillus frigoritolerans]
MNERKVLYDGRFHKGLRDACPLRIHKRFRAIHDVVTTHSYAQVHDINVKTILYNHYRAEDRIHQDNIETIEKLTGLNGLACIPTLADVRKDLRICILDLLGDQEYTQQLKEVFEA